MDVNLSLRMPRELRDAAMARSKRTGVSVAFVVRKRLEEWVASGE
jgi:predicted DNA-binding protein